MLTKKERSKEESDALIRAMAWNDGFGCYTRAGFEKMIWPEIAERARWIVYFDIDDIHALNKKFGSYDPVDAMVKAALSVVRITDYVAGQWKSGDEFLVCLTEEKQLAFSDQLLGSSELRVEIDPLAVVNRLEDALKREGLSATFAVVPVTSRDLRATMKPAVDMVYQGKEQRGDKR